MFDNKPTTSAASVKAVAGLSLSDVSYTQRDGFGIFGKSLIPTNINYLN